MVTLNKQDFEDGIGIVRKAANEDVIEDINKLASALSNEGENEMKASLMEQCRKFQGVYNNTFKPSIDALIKLFDDSFDYTEFMEKQTVSELGTTDAGFDVKALNAQSVNL